jgi:hypothetical protein
VVVTANAEGRSAVLPQATALNAPAPWLTSNLFGWTLVMAGPVLSNSGVGGVEQVRDR